MTPLATSSTAGHVVVVGLGKTGLSVARYLHAHGVAFAVTDTRAEPPGLGELRALAPAAVVRAGPRASPCARPAW